MPKDGLEGLEGSLKDECITARKTGFYWGIYWGTLPCTVPGAYREMVNLADAVY